MWGCVVLPWWPAGHLVAPQAQWPGDSSPAAWVLQGHHPVLPQWYDWSEEEEEEEDEEEEEEEEEEDEEEEEEEEVEDEEEEEEEEEKEEEEEEVNCEV